MYSPSSQKLKSLRLQARSIEEELQKKREALVPLSPARPKYKAKTCCQHAFMTLEDPSHSMVAKVLSTFIMTLIIAGCCIQIAESMESFQYLPDRCNKSSPNVHDCRRKALRIFHLIESICMLIFSLEYLLRILLVRTVPERAWLTILNEPTPSTHISSQPKPIVKPWVKENNTTKFPATLKTLRYMSQSMNLIDAIAIAPFWIQVVGLSKSSFGVIRIIRLTRVLRMLKSPSISSSVAVFYESFRASLPALTILFFYTMLAIILMGTLIFIFEQGEFTVDRPDLCCPHRETEECIGCYLRTTHDGILREPTPFTSIPSGMYWTIVTMSSVGYGDLAPTTTAGRFLAVLVSYSGILALALPISVIGNNFTSHYEQKRMEQKQKEIKILETKQKVADRFKSVLKQVTATRDSSISFVKRTMTYQKFSERRPLSTSKESSKKLFSAPRNLQTPTKCLLAALGTGTSKHSKVYPALSPVPASSQGHSNSAGKDDDHTTTDLAHTQTSENQVTPLEMLQSLNSTHSESTEHSAPHHDSRSPNAKPLRPHCSPVSFDPQLSIRNSSNVDAHKIDTLASMVADLQRAASMQQQTLTLLEKQLRSLSAPDRVAASTSVNNFSFSVVDDDGIASPTLLRGDNGDDEPHSTFRR